MTISRVVRRVLSSKRSDNSGDAGNEAHRDGVALTLTKQACRLRWVGGHGNHAHRDLLTHSVSEKETQ